MELAMENRDRPECNYMELVVDAYVHVLYRDRASQDLWVASFESEPIAPEAETRDAIVD